MTASASAVDLSVVIPVYQCRDCIAPLYERLRHVLAAVSSTYEIVFVDDRSPDDAWTIISDIAKRDRKVCALRLSRNFGQHAAITAGLAECSGRRAIVMDCDLQDPPEDIARLLEKADQGYDIVLARRLEKKHSLARRIASRIFFRLLGAFNELRMDGSFGSFSLISRPVIDAFLRFQDKDRHYLLILRWLGFRVGWIEFTHGERHAGASAYGWRALAGHALGGMFFQTTVLLHWIVYAGFGIASCGVLLAVYFVFLYFVHDVQPGWTSLFVLNLILGGFIIGSTGITGLYIGKIFEQVKGRPLYVIDRRTDRAVE
jgi:polyisoprenyl-phosphate glycosyltransferase